MDDAHPTSAAAGRSFHEQREADLVGCAIGQPGRGSRPPDESRRRRQLSPPECALLRGGSLRSLPSRQPSAHGASPNRRARRPPPLRCRAPGTCETRGRRSLRGWPRAVSRSPQRPTLGACPALGSVFSAAVIRLIVRTGVMLLANAVGLIVASLVLSGMDIDVTSFVFAVIIFMVVFALMLPFFASQLRRRGASALGGGALIATLISLIITDLISAGFSLSGIGTWLAAAVIVWAA